MTDLELAKLFALRRALDDEARNFGTWWAAPATRRLFGKLAWRPYYVHEGERLRTRKHGGRLPKLNKRRKAPPMWLVLKRHGGL